MDFSSTKTLENVKKGWNFEKGLNLNLEKTLPNRTLLKFCKLINLNSADYIDSNGI